MTPTSGSAVSTATLIDPEVAKPGPRLLRRHRDDQPALVAAALDPGVFDLRQDCRRRLCSGSGFAARVLRVGGADTGDREGIPDRRARQVGRNLQWRRAPARLVGRLPVGSHAADLVLEGSGTTAASTTHATRTPPDSAPRVLRRRAGIANSTMSTSIEMLLRDGKSEIHATSIRIFPHARAAVPPRTHRTLPVFSSGARSTRASTRRQCRRGTCGKAQSFPYQAGSISSPCTMVEGEPSGPTGTSPMSVTR